MKRISGKICKIHGEMNDTNATLHPSPWNKEYFRWRCTQCGKERSKQWREKNHDYHLSEVKKWRHENREYLRKKEKEDRKLNPEKFREYEKNKRKKDPERYSTYYIKQRYGITKTQYDEMLKNQANTCAICKMSESRKSKAKNGILTRLAVDHCHKTGKIRELLCHNCNTMIGKAFDSIDLLQSAIDYLRKHENLS